MQLTFLNQFIFFWDSHFYLATKSIDGKTIETSLRVFLAKTMKNLEKIAESS